MLVPAVYRCPDHDNQEQVTARVRERVEREAVIHPEQHAAQFRVSVMCPGNSVAPETAHQRVYDGTWQIAS